MVNHCDLVITVLTNNVIYKKKKSYFIEIERKHDTHP